MRERDRSGYLFVAPFAVATGLFLVVPTLYGLWMSFTNQSLTGAGSEFIGFANYAEAFSDPQVWQTLWHTVWFTVLSTVPLVLVALVMALLVHTGLPGQWVWRLSFFAPYLLPVAVVWLWATGCSSPTSACSTPARRAWALHPLGWLTDETSRCCRSPASPSGGPSASTSCCTSPRCRASRPSCTRPRRSTARAPGAGCGPSRCRSCATITGVIVVLQVLASLKVFDQIYMLTKGGPERLARGRSSSTSTTPASPNYRLGYASAVSYVFFALILVVLPGAAPAGAGRRPDDGRRRHRRRPPDEGHAGPRREPGPHEARPSARRPGRGPVRSRRSSCSPGSGCCRSPGAPSRASSTRPRRRSPHRWWPHHGLDARRLPAGARQRRPAAVDAEQPGGRRRWSRR